MPLSDAGASAGDAVFVIGETVASGNVSVTGAVAGSESLSLEVSSSGITWGFWMGEMIACSDDEAGESEPGATNHQQTAANTSGNHHASASPGVRTMSPSLGVRVSGLGGVFKPTASHAMTVGAGPLVCGVTWVIRSKPNRKSRPERDGIETGTFGTRGLRDPVEDGDDLLSFAEGIAGGGASADEIASVATLDEGKSGSGVAMATGGTTVTSEATSATLKLRMRSVIWEGEFWGDTFRRCNKPARKFPAARPAMLVFASITLGTDKGSRANHGTKARKQTKTVRMCNHSAICGKRNMKQGQIRENSG
jgi:hypothetical protein